MAIGDTECLVNASNETATLGGGVSRALHDECGGKLLQDEMREKLEAEFDGLLEEDDCLVTSAGSSKRFRYVLHVPSVDYRGPKARLGPRGEVVHTVTSVERIKSCTMAALGAAVAIAREEGVATSVAFPLLGAGSGGVPVGAACRAMAEGVRAFFADEPDVPLALVVLAVPEHDRWLVCRRVFDAVVST